MRPFNSVQLPKASTAVLWDMDGVLIDSLSLANSVCNTILEEVGAADTRLSKSDIRRAFPLSPDDFWRQLLGVAHVPFEAALHARVVERYEALRRAELYPLNPCVIETLEALSAAGIRQAVVSNTPKRDLVAILQNAGIYRFFDAVVGNDEAGLRRKPAPDSYLSAAAQLQVKPEQCVVVEDSVIGATAGKAAGCFVIGVATGAASFEELSASHQVDAAIASLAPSVVSLTEGNVQNKRLQTQNDFVSHMIEHIAWRTSSSVELQWTSDDWGLLGERVGQSLRERLDTSAPVAALGMIDDGSAEVLIDWSLEPGFDLQAVPHIDRDLILSTRVEQLAEPTPLVRLADGVARGVGARIAAKIWTFEDPHHTWEGLFRAIGIALARAMPQQPVVEADIGDAVTKLQLAAVSSADGGGFALTVSEVTSRSAKAVRRTAESEASLAIYLADAATVEADIETNETINVAAFGDLLQVFAAAAGLAIRLDFRATKLSSSHVVLEDIGILLGRALNALVQERMKVIGINAAGSSVKTAADLRELPIKVGLSIEGRKFLKFCPYADDYNAIRRRYLVGHDVFGHLRSEDLDDFLEGLTQGLAASAIVHVQTLTDAEDMWLATFRGLGAATRECLAPNPHRKGVPPGVKATLI